MLETIQSEIEEVKNIDFPEYYQQYVTKVQDEVIMKDLVYIKNKIMSITHLNSITRGVNRLIDELINRGIRNEYGNEFDKQGRRKGSRT